MLTSRLRQRPQPCVEAIEPRDPPAGLDLAGLAASVADSPVVAAAETAETAYNVGQLAYTGHTSLLFGAVQVSQPFALKNLGNGSASRVAPVAIRYTLPPSPSALAGVGEGGPDGDGHSADHNHGHGQGHRGDDQGHHRGSDHGATEDGSQQGHNGDHGD